MAMDSASTARAGGTDRLPVVALLGATTISRVGSMLTTVALPWFVLQTTGSAAQTGLVGSFVALPAFLAGIFGGVLVDRVGYKRVSVGADLVSGVGIALIPLLYQTIGLPFWQLLVLVFAGALLGIPGLTARRSLLPELARLAVLRLERVNASFEGTQYLAQLLGPALAGLLIVWLGAANVLLVDAATFAASAALVALAIPGAAGGPAITGSRYRDELAAGLRFLRRDRLLWTLVLTLAISNCLGAPLEAVILPVYARDVSGNPADLGFMVAAFGAGSIGGAVLFGMLGHRLPRRTTWIAAYMLWPLLFWVLALAPPVPVVAGTLALVGLVGGGLNPLLVTIRHERVPADLRGRVFSTSSAVASGVAPLGTVLGVSRTMPPRRARPSSRPRRSRAPGSRRFPWDSSPGDRPRGRRSRPGSQGPGVPSRLAPRRQRRRRWCTGRAPRAG
jgi:MFS family permease